MSQWQVNNAHTTAPRLASASTKPPPQVPTSWLPARPPAQLPQPLGAEPTHTANLGSACLSAGFCGMPYHEPQSYQNSASFAHDMPNYDMATHLGQRQGVAQSNLLAGCAQVLLLTGHDMPTRCGIDDNSAARPALFGCGLHPAAIPPAADAKVNSCCRKANLHAPTPTNEMMLAV